MAFVSNTTGSNSSLGESSGDGTDIDTDEMSVELGSSDSVDNWPVTSYENYRYFHTLGPLAWGRLTPLISIDSQTLDICFINPDHQIHSQVVSTIHHPSTWGGPGKIGLNGYVWTVCQGPHRDWESDQQRISYFLNTTMQHVDVATVNYTFVFLDPTRLKGMKIDGVAINRGWNHYDHAAVAHDND